MVHTAVPAGAAGGVSRDLRFRRTRAMAEILLLALGAGHVLQVSVAGAVGTGTDLAVAVLLAVWTAELVGGARGDAGGAVDAASAVPASFLVGAGLLALFAGWVAASALWGFHPGYALVKGAGLGGLALAAAAVGSSGLPWRRAVDAWLGGVAVALLLTVLLFLAGPEGRATVVYEQGGVQGLTFPRIRGPMVHPNMLGGYLAVSGVLLWARWPSLGRRGRAAGALLGGAMALALILSVSTAWVGAAVAVAALALWGGRGPGRVVVAAGSAVVAALTGFALIASLDMRVEGAHLVTNGIRPGIWAGALEAFLEAPLAGVGAAPYLARVADPLLPSGGEVYWDAHNLYLSVAGQFGLLGLGLFTAGVGLAARAAYRAPDRRARVAALVMLGVLAVNGLFTASEDLRHVWMAVGLMGVAGASGRGEGAQAE